MWEPTQKKVNIQPDLFKQRDLRFPIFFFNIFFLFFFFNKQQLLLHFLLLGTNTASVSIDLASPLNLYLRDLSSPLDLSVLHAETNAQSVTTRLGRIFDENVEESNQSGDIRIYSAYFSCSSLSSIVISNEKPAFTSSHQPLNKS